MDAPSGFTWRRLDADTILARTEHVAALESLLPRFLDGELALPGTAVAGGRGGVLVVDLPGGPRAVLRRNLRGGVPARVLRDVYVGCRPRPFAEVAVTERLRALGVPVPMAVGAIVRRLGPCCYRGAVATVQIGDTKTLWDYLVEAPSLGDRRQAVRAALAAVRRLLAVGAAHPDLNLRNFLISDQPPGLRVWIIDCDRARFAPLRPWRRWRVQRRLQRSARRLDPHRGVIDPAWFVDESLWADGG